MVYLSLIFLLVVFFLFTWRKDNIFYFLISVFFIFFILAFRDFDVGADTLNYVNYFLENTSVYSINDSRPVEAGFKGYVDFVRKIWKDGTFFLFFNAALTLSAPMFFVRKYSMHKSLSLLLFLVLPTNLYFLHYIALRQMLAQSLLLWGIYFYKERSSITLFGLFSFMAVYLHTSAILMIIIFFLADKIRVGKIQACFLVVATYILGVNGAISFNDLATWMFSFLTDTPLDRMSGYVLWDGKEVDVKLLSFLSLLCFLVYFYIDELYVNDIALKLFLFGVLMMNLFSNFPMIGRVANFFIFFGVIAISFCWVRQFNKIRTLLLLFVIVYFLGRTVTTIAFYDSDSEMRILPYSFMF